MDRRTDGRCNFNMPPEVPSGAYKTFIADSDDSDLLSFCKLDFSQMPISQENINDLYRFV